MNKNYEHLYLTTPIDGNNVNHEVDNSISFCEFPGIIQDIEDEYDNLRNDTLNYSSMMNSCSDWMYHKNEDNKLPNSENLLSNLNFIKSQELNIFQNGHSNSITLQNELNKILLLKKSQGFIKKIKTSTFMKKNWKIKLNNFRENRLQKLFWKVNPMKNNNFNNYNNLGYNDNMDCKKHSDVDLKLYNQNYNFNRYFSSKPLLLTLDEGISNFTQINPTFSLSKTHYSQSNRMTSMFLLNSIHDSSTKMKNELLMANMQNKAQPINLVGYKQIESVNNASVSNVFQLNSKRKKCN